MYKQLNANHFRTRFGFPENYEVEAVIIYGALGGQVYADKFILSLDALGIKGELVRTGLLGNVFEFKYNDKNYWFIVAYGTTVLSENLHVASMLGSKKNIHIGSCGGLNKEANAGDLIIATFSYGNESTTRMYERENPDHRHFPNDALGESLKNRAGSSFVIRKGPIMTVQAMLAETAEDVQDWADEGYYGVEMETATIFAISNHFNIPSAGLVYVHDNLIKGQIVGDEQHVKEKDLREKVKDEMFRITISELLSL
ncbi:MAG: hypothetical protein ABIO57_02060 [Candidatus Paceibacterota bacterium]